MSCYVLNNISLRSWWLVPYAFVQDGSDIMHHLSEEQFSLLKRCDGKTEIEDSEILRSLLYIGIIREAKDGEVTESFRMARAYENRYVPNMALVFTTYCNFNCIHCYEAADNEIIRQQMDFDKCMHVIDEAESCGILNFKITGGEPMMHPHFLDIVQYIYEKGMRIRCIYTNGYFITKEMLDKLQKIDPGLELNISYDGAGFHDWMRGREGAEKGLLEKIKLCVEYGFPVRIATNVNRVNLPALRETLDKMEAMGARELRVLRTSESPRWQHNAGDATMPMEEYYDEMVELCRYYATKERSITLNMWQFARLVSMNKTYSLTAVSCPTSEYSPHRPICSTARSYITVMPDGRIYPCTPSSGVYLSKNETFENVFETGLQPILQESKYLAFNCAGAQRVAEYDKKCASCKFFRQCLGGCRVSAWELNNHRFAHDNFKCAFFENRYDLKLKKALPGYTCLIPVEG